MVRAVHCHREEASEQAQPGKAPARPGWHEAVVEELRPSCSGGRRKGVQGRAA